MESNFLTNTTELTFLDKIKQSLQTCTEFNFTVSFIKKAGLILLINDIREALNRGVVGRLITSTYQNFTDISSLDTFLELQNEYPNFECHLDINCFQDCGFHSKGYLFKYNDYSEAVIGSSNITRFALLKNIEWNISVCSDKNKVVIDDSFVEFDNLWNKTQPLTQDLINDYSRMLDYAIERWDMDYDFHYESKIKPNYMQVKALKEISKLRGRGIDKALIIAATGSGKTYLAAFDARNYGAQRLLFIVHRDTILKDAIKTFKTVFGAKKTYGLYNGKSKEFDKDFIFTTNSTISNNLDLFSKKEFDYIIVDEVHHATASTYQKIINYFEPEFLLGLTATPERMDEKSVFEIFENNVPFELRLRDALLNDLVVPFKYYGIHDSLVDYSLDKTNTQLLIRQISDETHCEFIKDNIEKYRTNGKLKAIGFCRTIQHAKEMSEKMNNLGYVTTYLSGQNSTGERIAAYKALEEDNGPLEIIFAVDLLNEGIDIPAINMVLFLRPTESSTIFIQQLGRGLRKYENKEYLTVLDFIGNSYTRSVQIAIALGGLSSNGQIDKRLLRSFVGKDFKQIDLPIEIHLDEESKDEILKAIDSTNFNTMILLEQEYRSFKNYLGLDTYVKHVDYLNSEVASNINRFIKKKGSYYNFLESIKEDIPLFDENQKEFIKYLSTFLPLIRPYEFLIVKELLDGPKSYEELKNNINQFNNFDVKQFDHALGNLQYSMYSELERKLKTLFINYKDNKYSIDLNLTDSFKDFVGDLLEYGLEKYNNDFYNNTGLLKLYYNYNRTSLLTALCHHTLAFREGILFKDNQLYLFIDLKKDASKAEWLKYNDKFISSSLLHWESQIETTMDNKKGLKLQQYKKAHVFVRKAKTEDGIIQDYIYIGEGEMTNPRPSNNVKKSLLFDIILDNKIPDYLKYDFEIEEEEVDKNGKETL